MTKGTTIAKMDDSEGSPLFLARGLVIMMMTDAVQALAAHTNKPEPGNEHLQRQNREAVSALVDKIMQISNVQEGRFNIPEELPIKDMQGNEMTPAQIHSWMSAWVAAVYSDACKFALHMETGEQ